MTYAIGDKVRFRDGLMDFDNSRLSVAGWTGAVVEVFATAKGARYVVELDATTVALVTAAHRRAWRDNGNEHDDGRILYTLGASELEATA